MEVDSAPPASLPVVSRETTAPFLIRAFIKIGGFHHLSLFEDGTVPTTDEQQIFTWRDATLREVLTTIRNTAPHIPEYRHPLARFSFKAVYADSGSRGRFSEKSLGMVYSRDILGEPGALNVVAPRLLEDADGENRELSQREKEERTLDELRFSPGDYLLAAVLLPKHVTVPSELSIKGSAATSNGWKGSGGPAAGRADNGWAGASSAPSGGPSRGGGHWRGESNAPSAPRGRGRGDHGRDRDRDRDRDGERRVPPPRRGGDSPPPRGGGWGRGRGGRGGRSRSPSRSRSRSRTPPRRRNPRYD